MNIYRIINTNLYRPGGFKGCLSFPKSSEQLRFAMQMAGCTGETLGHYYVKVIRVIGNTQVCNAFQEIYLSDHEGIDALNELACILSRMERKEEPRVLAIMDYLSNSPAMSLRAGPYSVAEIVELVCARDRFVFKPRVTNRQQLKAECSSYGSELESDKEIESYMREYNVHLISNGLVGIPDYIFGAIHDQEEVCGDEDDGMSGIWSKAVADMLLDAIVKRQRAYMELVRKYSLDNSQI